MKLLLKTNNKMPLVITKKFIRIKPQNYLEKICDKKLIKKNLKNW